MGVRCIALTTDGCATNLAELKYLGCDMKSGISHSIPHPSDPSLNIFIIMDPANTIKLVRNMLADIGVLYTKWGAVRWQHVVDLHQYQLEEGVTSANRLSERHINWERQKMKVIIQHLFT